MHLAGYQIFEEIGETDKTTVYRARRDHDGKNVIIKTSSHPALYTSQFRQEYEASVKLDIDGVLKIDRMEEYQDGVALVMEDFGGVSLKKIILTKSIGLKEQLQIAVRLTDTLGRLHARQVIHGDIKPSNVIVNLSSGEVRITDLATSQSFGENEPLNNYFMTGTLAYMSPEQTGRMNRMPDHRTAQGIGELHSQRVKYQMRVLPL